MSEKCPKCGELMEATRTAVDICLLKDEDERQLAAEKAMIVRLKLALETVATAAEREAEAERGRRKRPKKDYHANLLESIARTCNRALDLNKLTDDCRDPVSPPEPATVIAPSREKS